MIRFAATLSAVCLIFATPAALGQANLVMNGSFETGPALGPNGFTPVNVGSTSIDGWTVIRGQIDFVGNARWTPVSGTHALDLDGSPGSGGVQQTITTTSTVRHTLAFLLAGNPGGVQGIKSLQVSADAAGQEFQFDTSGHSYANMGWTWQYIDFTPAAAQTQIALYSLGPGSNFGPAIDDVIVQPCFVIARPPVLTSVCPTGSAEFTILVVGTGPFTYEWQIQSVPPPNETWLTLTTSPVPLPCGATSYATATPSNAPTVSIFVRSTCPDPPPGAPSRWPIRCIVSNDCGSAASTAATLTFCPVDFNCSGGAPTVQDVFDFVTAWFAASPSADFNTVGGITVQDVFDFLTAWFTGCG